MVDTTLPDRSVVRFEWGSIIAGAILSLAISVILLQFGSIIGLSATSPLRGEGSIAAWGVIAAGVWLLWIQLLASLAGGYVAGRLRTSTASLPRHDSELRDGMAGMLSWAVGTVVAFSAASLYAALASYAAIHSEPSTSLEVINDPSKNTLIIFAFAAGASSLVSAIAAWWAGTVGGDHRDSGIDLSQYLAFK